MLHAFYVECKTLDFTPAFCDAWHQCAYLPHTRVALEANPDPTQSSAIQVLATKSNAIDRAALRLLPKSTPASAVARQFLIPALAHSESEIRRLTVISALLQSKYLSIKNRQILKSKPSQLSRECHSFGVCDLVILFTRQSPRTCKILTQQSSITDSFRRLAHHGARHLPKILTLVPAFLEEGQKALYS